jgi:hypothetical protein
MYKIRPDESGWDKRKKIESTRTKNATKLNGVLDEIVSVSTDCNSSRNISS